MKKTLLVDLILTLIKPEFQAVIFVYSARIIVERVKKAQLFTDQERFMLKKTVALADEVGFLQLLTQHKLMLICPLLRLVQLHQQFLLEGAMFLTLLTRKHKAMT